MKINRETHGHGRPKTPTYITWQDMRSRCENKNNKKYDIYGGKGIKVCKEWSISFITFLKDMGEKPKGMTIERKNGNKGYYPENCKWATYAEQNRNISRNRKITIKGKTKCLVDWVAETNLKYNTVLYRILRGWNPEEALTTQRQ